MLLSGGMFYLNVYFVVLCLVATSLSDIDVSLENASDRGRVRAR